MIAVKQVAEADGIVLITQEGKILRTQAAGVRQTGRGAMGVKLMDVEGEDRLIAAARVTERDDEVAADDLEPPPIAGAPVADDDAGGESGRDDGDDGEGDDGPETVH